MQRDAHSITESEIRQLLDSAIQDYEFAAYTLAIAEQNMTIANRLREQCHRALDAADPDMRHRAREAIALQWNHVFG